MRKLFLSLTRTVQGIAAGTIHAADLDSGFFMLSCPREIAMMVSTDGPTATRSWSGVEARHHNTLIAAILKAETEKKRVVWVMQHGLRATNETRLLNILLKANNLPLVPSLGAEDPPTLSYQAVGRKLEQAGLELEAIY